MTEKDENGQSRVVVVTGGANGLGRGLVLHLLDEGWAVAVLDCDEQAIHDLTSTLESRGGSRLILRCDISDPTEVEGSLDLVERRLGPLSVLINCAIWAVPTSVLDVDLADWKKALDTNLTGYFITSRSAAIRMKARRHGRIVNLSSGSADRGIPTTLLYACPKGGVNAMTRVFAVELAQHGVTVNTVVTGALLTSFFERMAGNVDDVNARISRIPMRRFGEIDEVAGLIDYLISPLGGWTTGSTAYVDGGANNAAMVLAVHG